jgi:hypothetical protein
MFKICEIILEVPPLIYFAPTPNYFWVRHWLRETKKVTVQLHLNANFMPKFPNWCQTIKCEETSINQVHKKLVVTNHGGRSFTVDYV